MMIPDRRLRTNERPNRTIAVTWLILCGLLLAVGWSPATDARLPGVELAVMALAPMLAFGAIVLAVGRLAWRLFDTEVAIFACFAVAMWPPILEHLQPMRISPQSWQIACVAVAAWTLSWRDDRAGAAAAGLALGAGVAISLELVPIVLAFATVLALRWWRDYRERGWLAVFMAAFAASLLAWFAVAGNWAMMPGQCGAIAPWQIVTVLAMAAGTWGLARLPQMPRIALAGGWAVVAGAGMTIAWLMAPGCGADQLALFAGPAVWNLPAALAVPAAVQALVALAACLTIMARSQDWVRRWWSEYALLLALATAAGFLATGALAFAAVLGAVPLGWLARQMLRMWRTSGSLPVRLGSLLVICGVLVPSAPLTVARQFDASPHAQSDQVRPDGNSSPRH